MNSIALQALITKLNELEILAQQSTVRTDEEKVIKDSILLFCRSAFILVNRAKNAAYSREMRNCKDLVRDECQ